MNLYPKKLFILAVVLLNVIFQAQGVLSYQKMIEQLRSRLVVIFPDIDPTTLVKGTMTIKVKKHRCDFSGKISALQKNIDNTYEYNLIIKKESYVNLAQGFMAYYKAAFQDIKKIDDNNRFIVGLKVFIDLFVLQKIYEVIEAQLTIDAGR